MTRDIEAYAWGMGQNILCSMEFAYDPSCDPEGNILRAGSRLMEHVVHEVEISSQRGDISQ